MRAVHALVAALLTTTLAPQELQADLLDDLPTCIAAVDNKATLESCSRVIESGTVTGKDLATAYLNRGIVHAKSGNNAAALKDLSAAVELRPDDPLTLDQARFDLAIMQLIAGQSDAGREGLWSLAKEPASDFAPWSVYQLATDPRVVQPGSAELVSAARAVLAHSDTALAHRALGLALANTGQRDEAIREIEKAMAMAKAANARQLVLDNMQKQIDAIATGNPIREPANAPW